MFYKDLYSKKMDLIYKKILRGVISNWCFITIGTSFVYWGVINGGKQETKMTQDRT